MQKIINQRTNSRGTDDFGPTQFWRMLQRLLMACVVRETGPNRAKGTFFY